jgi:hypothetical protein
MFRKRFFLALCCLGLAACASSRPMGIMTADWVPGEKSKFSAQKVMIAWESESAITGSMTFTLGKGGQRYVGPFLLIEKSVGHVETQPFYDAWDSASYGAWDVGGVNPWFEPGWGISVWVDHYDGRIISTLQGDRGGSARCHFTLSHTSAGLPGGGSGECQVSDGGVLDATF